MNAKDTPNTAWSPYPQGTATRSVIPQTTLDLLAAEQACRDLDKKIANSAAHPRGRDKPLGCSSDCRAPGCGGGCSQ